MWVFFIGVQILFLVDILKGVKEVDLLNGLDCVRLFVYLFIPYLVPRVVCSSYRNSCRTFLGKCGNLVKEKLSVGGEK